MTRAAGSADLRLVIAVFFISGVVAVMLGPVIPTLRAEWGVSHAEAGWLFVAQFLGSSAGAVASSFHLRWSLLAGYGAMAVGLAGLALGGWALALPAMGTVGVGLGLSIAASNLWVARREPRRRGAVLATLNLVWGLGAVSSPLWFTVALGRLPVESVFGVLALLAALACVALWRVLDERVASPAAAPRGGAPRPAALLLFAAMFFLYVGTENAVAGWLVALADELAEGRPAVSLLIGSAFWGAVLIGRGAAPRVLERVAEPRLYGGCLALAGAGTLALALAGTRPTVAVAGTVAGLGLAPLFPLIVSALVTTTAGPSRQHGWVMACGGLGGAALPWLSGQVADRWGEVRYGFWVPLTGLLVLALLHVARRAAPLGGPADDPLGNRA